jgi:hypothetical protein
VLVDYGDFFSRENRFAALLLGAEKVAQSYAILLADIDKSFHGFTIDEIVFSVNQPMGQYVPAIRLQRYLRSHAFLREYLQKQGVGDAAVYEVIWNFGA